VREGGREGGRERGGGERDRETRTASSKIFRSMPSALNPNR
jgi:hypothetical protein